MNFYLKDVHRGIAHPRANKGCMPHLNANCTPWTRSPLPHVPVPTVIDGLHNKSADVACGRETSERQRMRPTRIKTGYSSTLTIHLGVYATELILLMRYALFWHAEHANTSFTLRPNPHSSSIPTFQKATLGLLRFSRLRSFFGLLDVQHGT
jgi:hypothetical protein